MILFLMVAEWFIGMFTFISIRNDLSLGILALTNFLLCIALNYLKDEIGEER